MPAEPPPEPWGTPAIPPPSAPAAPPPGRETAISRTATGLALLAVAVLLQWIPVIQYLGLFLGAVGAILMILGRAPFGPRHEILVGVSVGVFVLTYLGEVVLGMSFAASVEAIGSATGSAAASAFLGAWDGLEEGALVAVALLSVCFALIAFDLEDAPGRLLLIAGVVSQIVISTYLLVGVADPIIRQTVTQAFASNPVDVSVIQAGDAQIHGLSGLSALNAIPALLVAGAYAWAIHRIHRGVLPPPAPPSARTSPTLLVGLVAVLVVLSAGTVGGVLTLGVPTTPAGPLAWTPVATFTGTATGRTANFTVTAASSTLNESVVCTASCEFDFSVYAAGSGTLAVSCGMGGGGGGPMQGGCGGPGRGTYYLVVTKAVNVSAWTLDVVQLS